MLIIWTAAPSDLLKNTFGPGLRSFRPDIPEHRFVEYTGPEDEPPVPAAGDVILVCGAKPLDVLRRHKIVHKSRTLGGLREAPVSHGAGAYFVTLDPYTTVGDPAALETIRWDLRLAVRYMRTGSIKPQIGKYSWVNSFQPTIDWIEKRFAATGKPVDVACDTETMGFYPWYPDKDIVSISFTARPHTADVLYLGPLKPPVPLDPSVNLFDQILWLLTSPQVKLRMANGKYDLIWIAEKWGIECTNFKFDSMLVGTLLDENRSNALSLHTKTLTTMGGYDLCAAPHTRVLTEDLRWVALGSLKVGDRLVGFDEHVPAPRQRRKLRSSEVLNIGRITKPSLRLTLSNGVQIDCSWNHGFLSSPRPGRGPLVWRMASQLRVGSRIKLVAPVVQQGQDYASGWMGGFLDGEGFVSKADPKKTGAFVLGWSQKPGPVWDTAVEIMSAEVGSCGYVRTKPIDGVLTASYTQWPALSALMKFRPGRLIAKKKWEGASLPQEPEVVTVSDIEDIGSVEVVTIETSTHTFVAEGTASHNSFDKTYDKGHMERIPAGDDLLTYAGGDTDATQRVSDVLRDELLEDEKLANFYINILHPAARAFEKLERRGVLVDQEKYAALRQDLVKVIDNAHQNVLEILPNRLRIKHRDKIESQLAAGKSPLTGTIIKEFFFSPFGLNLKPKLLTGKTQEPSTAKAHLRQFADDPAAAAMVAALTEADSASKTLSTFVDGFLKHLRPDGRFHSTYYLGKAEFEGHEEDESGTVTGRLSAKDPPFQVTPKKTFWAKRIRECFIAPKGKLVISVDYSQGELKVVACWAPEPTMLQSYADGLDLHAVTGARLAQVELAEFLSWKDHQDKELAELFEKHRGNAKPANFGLLYGMGVEGFMAYAWANYGIRLSYAEAEAMRNAFFELYAGLPAYHDRQREIARLAQAVRSPLGRVRHLPMIKSWDREIRSKANRQAINSPIQSCLSDMMLWAIALIEDAYPGGEIEIVGMIHDALIAYVPEQDAEVWAARMVEVMANLPFHKVGWNPQLKFTADAELGPNLAALKKLKIAA